MITKEELKIMNYIFGKEKDNKQFSELELNCASKIDLFDIKVVNLCKIIWDNKDDEKRLEKFMKMLSNNDRKIINREEDKHMNDIMIFKNNNFGEIQIINENGKYEFEATGIAKILKYVNPHDAILRHCKKDGVVKHEVIDNLGRKQQKNFISEGNLYRLIAHSKLQEAGKFECWVFDEVLPSIRENGSYSLDTNGLMKQLTQSQITLNNVLAGFKMQIDNDFKVANEKITEHDELLKKRVYLSAKEAKDIQNAIKARAQQISIDNGFRYHKVKARLFKRLYMKLNDIFEVATYRELPSIYYEDILNTIKSLNVGIFDLREEECQLSLNIN